MRLHLDLETRSRVDLTKTGVYVYSEDESTRIIVARWKLDNGPLREWTFLQATRFPDELLDLLDNPAVTVVAHNAGFERTMLNGPPGRRLGVRRPIPLERWNCTAARAACFGLPRSLDGAGAALGLAVQKDKDGKALMLRMCKPLPFRRKRRDETPDEFAAAKAEHAAGPPEWLEDPDSVARLSAYCAIDVEVEHAIDGLLPELYGMERGVWLQTERMNDRGVRIDLALLDAVTQLVAEAEAAVNQRLARLTNGRVLRVSDHGAITRWLQEYDADDNLGEDGIGKAALAALLEREDLPPLVRDVLRIRQDNGKSSTAKYRTIRERLSSDGTVKGCFVYCGASGTSRFSSRGLQLQNLPRGGSVKNIPEAIAELIAGLCLELAEDLYGPAMVLAAELLRPIIIAEPDHWFARGDYSQIEARILPWLAGAEWKVQAFRDYDTITGTDAKGKPKRKGPDLYRVAAGKIAGCDAASVTDDQRQTGKVSELACGYGGGKGAFMAFAKIYKLKIAEAEAETIKTAWRESNPEVVRLWSDLERAAIACMQAPPDGRLFPVGDKGVGFKRNAKALLLRLPSGHCIFHWWPRLTYRQTPWGEDRLTVIFRAEDPKTTRWTEFAAYGGIWAAVLTQATARDVMAYALLQLADEDMFPVLTVHDEAGCLVPHYMAETADEAARLVALVMQRKPDWLGDCPLAADSSAADRYLKG
ncbi:DNA polymerase [Roseomonas sp. USHLN139]|uniref:DNA polymerase n=1 Tax=Roseomonas sp. USHLN139 TaxID=3081298 RepID=UPI003B0108C0